METKKLEFIEQSNRLESVSKRNLEIFRGSPVSLPQSNNQHTNVRKMTQGWVKNNLRKLEETV